MTPLPGSFEELSSDKAIVCRREINCEQGGATVHMVVLADGFLLDCGTDRRRAVILARVINRGRPELFTKAGLATIKADDKP